MGQDLGMKSRVHPKYKTKYRVGNWSEYDRSLVQRGDLTLWISADAIDAWKKESGYHRQARVENAFFRYKSIIGDRLRARHPKAQKAEALIACNILNGMTALGRPASCAIGA